VWCFSRERAPRSQGVAAAAAAAAAPSEREDHKVSLPPPLLPLCSSAAEAGERAKRAIRSQGVAAASVAATALLWQKRASERAGGGARSQGIAAASVAAAALLWQKRASERAVGGRPPEPPLRPARRSHWCRRCSCVFGRGLQTPARKTLCMRPPELARTFGCCRCSLGVGRTPPPQGWGGARSARAHPTTYSLSIWSLVQRKADRKEVSRCLLVMGTSPSLPASPPAPFFFLSSSMRFMNLAKQCARRFFL
jgi:hypothetical protein